MHHRRILSLAGPVYAELLAGVVAGVIDIAWVARLGAGSVAAVAVATNVENALMGAALVVELGVTVLISTRRGAGRPPGAAIRAAWLLYALITPAVAVPGFLLRHQIAGLFGAPEAAGFLAVSMPGLALYFGQLVVFGVFKGRGDTRTPMRLALLGNLVLLVLDPLLIYGLGLGVEGAALATAIGRGVSLAAGLWLLRTVRGGPGSLRADVRAIAATGTPMAAEFATRQAGALAMAGIVAGFGTVALAAYGIGTKAMYAATMGFYAVRQGATIHTSHAVGTGDADVRGIARHTLRIAAVVGLAAAVVYATAGEWLMRVFTSEDAVIAAGTGFLRWMAPYLLALSCLIAATGVLLGTGSGGRLFLITLTGTALQLPLAFALSRAWGLPGVWIALIASVAGQLMAVRVLGVGRSARGVETDRPGLIRTPGRTRPWRTARSARR
ncbi:MATE family efflux transporter [Actinorhabdospora filicis]|uniref:Probable multidrug resistance protein NorM n=1 Tax=Actinorhabdospora filicis TaxID=1785913 RepID=A0A9W6SPF6_9ACTN|nr:MATE family efflux transporter [Actinorhabdospora filicis]GLZ79472.1 MATE family efflux transporter [Actinorhabdospora filicis]